MEDRKQQLLLFRQRNQLAGFLHIQRKGLIHYHMFPGIQRQFG
jgi:hypothetical protein